MDDRRAEMTEGRTDEKEEGSYLRGQCCLESKFCIDTFCFLLPGRAVRGSKADAV